MLTALRIQNLALVEDLSLEFGPGFTVLTGETGAGKSLLVTALALLVGARAETESVRSGADKAQVEAIVEGPFEPWTAFLEAKGFGSELPVVLRRELSSTGRSRAWINGSACTLADLREAGRLWMRLSSQHDHQALLAPERHLGLLDEILGLKADLETLVQEVRDASGALKARRQAQAQRDRRLAELEEWIGELEKLHPMANEYAQLRAEREGLRHAAQLASAFLDAETHLEQAQKGLEAARKALTRTVSILPEIQTHLDRLRSAALDLEDLHQEADGQARHWSEAGTERMERMEDRLARIERFSRRLGCEPEELPTRFKELKAERSLLLGGEASLEELEKALKKASTAYAKRAQRLHDTRTEGASALEIAVHQRFSALGMKGARLQVRLGLQPDPASPVLVAGQAVALSLQGFTSVEFWIETNPGEGFHPLHRTASGGELSRVMLALLASAHSTQASGLSLILDEVDAGIGGETALAVGRAVAELGRSHQVLAVTHLAQVAARADHHLFIWKQARKGRTTSGQRHLDREERVRELARLLSGQPDSSEALDHARSLLASSGNKGLMP